MPEAPLATRFATVSDTPPEPAKLFLGAETFVCPLSQVEPGTVCRVKQLLGTPEICLRLRELGFCEQQKVRMLKQERAMICQVCNARLALNAKLADVILVEPIQARDKVA